MRIVVCVQRENAVWHLQHILRPFNEITKDSPLFTCELNAVGGITMLLYNYYV